SKSKSLHGGRSQSWIAKRQWWRSRRNGPGYIGPAWFRRWKQSAPDFYGAGVTIARSDKHGLLRWSRGNCKIKVVVEFLLARSMGSTLRAKFTGQLMLKERKGESPLLRISLVRIK